MIDVVASMFLRLYIFTAHKCRTLHIHYCTHSACEVRTFNTPPSQVTPMLPSGPTHCHSHHCAHCVRYHEVRLSTVWSVYVPHYKVFCPERSTGQTSMNTPGHRPATQQPLTSLSTHTHTHGAILNQHRNRRKCSPSHAEWFC